MKRTEAQFCRDEAERLLALFNECTDPKVRDRLAIMANDWLERGKAKEDLQSQRLPQSELGIR